MPHILIAGKLHPAGLALLDATDGVTCTHVEEISEASYQPWLAQADGMVIRTQPMTAASVAKAERLQIVSRHGVGYDAVDVAALNARGIPLCIVGDVNSVSVAEHAMMQILACAKQLIRSDRAVRNGPWGWRNRLEQGEVSGKSLLIIGYGRIGRHLATMAAAFGMKISAHDPYLASKGWPEGHVACADDLAAALAGADFVSVHIPKADKPIIGVVELALMKRGAIIVNTARGGIVDEAALADALRSGQIAAAALDVFDVEPPGPDHPLLAFDQVILTPHTAGLTAEAAERMAVASVQNVLDFFAGRLDPALVVNAPATRGTKEPVK
ncbi:MAG: hydroxyacid dehydrogenase [Tabrizicola sp.]|uniref:hydroxyacid dehydrogenase n=1 Tax=Tabrizicola sp. TaxID=2005166 RepID=UPI0027340AA0|nr:hydroxyacid dehydrogenase [Tabrizicola sp.]MDP3262102.1 hydroxyacid dehydrogenase [Tabrizicola sp.]MDP3648152.1 hydroxyacid dehydrogenase [Paracoccaceae bacterium]MDZ4069687.1 hydroxyacid dehydrogenase [Tabrizicola sp.]